MAGADRPWTAFYGPDVRRALDRPSYRNLPDLIGPAAETYGTAKVFICCLLNWMIGALAPT